MSAGVLILTPTGSRHHRFRIRPGIDVATLQRLGCAKRGGCARAAMFSTSPTRGGSYSYWCEVHGKRQHVGKCIDEIAGRIDAVFDDADDVTQGGNPIRFTPAADE